MRLYDMATELRNRADSIQFDEETGEILNPEIFDDLPVDFKEKAEWIVKIIREKTASVEALKEEEARIKKRRVSFEKQVDRLRSYLAESILQTGEKKLKTALFTVSARCERKAFINKKGNADAINDFLSKYGEFRKTKIELDESKFKLYALSHEGDPEIAAFVEFKDIYTPTIR